MRYALCPQRRLSESPNTERLTFLTIFQLRYAPCALRYALHAIPYALCVLPVGLRTSNAELRTVSSLSFTKSA